MEALIMGDATNAGSPLDRAGVVLGLIRGRRAIRSYTNEAIDDQSIRSIVEAATTRTHHHEQTSR